MPGGMDEFLWFVAGIFSYRVIASVLNYGHMYSFMSSLKEDVIKFLTILEEDMKQAQSIKYAYLRSSNSAEEEVEEEIKKDKQRLHIWKEVTISRLKTNWPRYYKELVKFNSWEEGRKDFENNIKK